MPMIIWWLGLSVLWMFFVALMDPYRYEPSPSYGLYLVPPVIFGAVLALVS